MVVAVDEGYQFLLAFFPLLLEAPLQIFQLGMLVCCGAYEDEVHVPQEEAEQDQAHDGRQHGDKDQASFSGQHVLADDQQRRRASLPGYRVHEGCDEEVLLNHYSVQDGQPEASAVDAQHQVPEEEAQEPPVVADAHAVVDPDAVVVSPRHAAVAERAVLGPRGLLQLAGAALALEVELLIPFVNLAQVIHVLHGDSTGVCR
eukprot:CAMPEP_0168362624 /NCGR_PEP_ID=MMETSP0228-20121227/3273_1 /TAXON_ID=133427 /ORGANISM="Protoceratium reticulatum, Strain CCCM 535 (=CCMP 1889)" /LENGTH=201 /DNA_ID=CAMNT_0008375329 /DNA_START=33 /DNA_END=634 /DNA_ORIENTATION=+